MEHDRVHLGSPHRSRWLVDHQLWMRTPARIRHLHRADVVRRPLRRILREEPLTVDALAETLQRDRAVAVRGDELRADGDEITREIELRDSRFRVEDAVRA